MRGSSPSGKTMRFGAPFSLAKIVSMKLMAVATDT
jgi:hypothetical protein